MFLDATGITKQFDGKPILRDVSFTVDDGGIVSFIGPSGVGKTTLLKIIAGLDRADEGELRYSSEPSKEHPVILVFQDYLLFPNLTVFENVAFGLRARKRKEAEIKEQVLTLLEHFGLTDKQKAYPAALSAGQRQRVAIARAMVVNPAMLLLDEPFANLDRNLKLSTAEFIRDTQKEFGVTTIVVTHDQEEAFLMSDLVGVMLDGSLAQYAPPQELYDKPVNLAVAEFLGPVNVLDETTALRLGIPRTNSGYYVRPERLALSPNPEGAGTVTKRVFAGAHIQYGINIGPITVTVHRNSDTVAVGDRVDIKYKREAGE